MYSRDEEDFNIDPFYENKNHDDFDHDVISTEPRNEVSQNEMIITNEMTYRETLYQRGMPDESQNNTTPMIKASSIFDPNNMGVHQVINQDMNL